MLRVRDSLVQFNELLAKLLKQRRHTQSAVIVTFPYQSITQLPSHPFQRHQRHQGTELKWLHDGTHPLDEDGERILITNW